MAEEVVTFMANVRHFNVGYRKRRGSVKVVLLLKNSLTVASDFFGRAETNKIVTFVEILTTSKNIPDKSRRC
jgi:hypothetical protein